MIADALDRGAEARRRSVPMLRLAVVLALAVACGRGGAEVKAGSSSSLPVAQGADAAAARPEEAPLVTGPGRTPEDRKRCEEEEERRIRDGLATPIVVPEAPTRLRATPTTHTYGSCEDAVDRAGFRTLTHWSGGCFVNLFYAPGPEVVVDLATGLMWQRYSSRDQLAYAKALRLVDGLNAKRFGGHTGWRLPTTEELFSILEKPIETTDNIHRLAGHDFHSWWSVDPFEDWTSHCYILEYQADCNPTENVHTNDVVVVRTVPDAELAGYREAVRAGGLKAQLAGRAILPAHEEGKP